MDPNMMPAMYGYQAPFVMTDANGNPQYFMPQTQEYGTIYCGIIGL